MSKRPRDTQRSKVYRSEPWAEFHERTEKYETLAEAEALVEKIMNSKWYLKQAVRKFWPLRLEIIHRPRSTWGRGSNKEGVAVLNLPPAIRYKSVVLHEFAHALQSKGTAWHGREFCRIYLDLVHRWLGPDFARQLRENFKDNGVKYRIVSNGRPSEREI